MRKNPLAVYVNEKVALAMFYAAMLPANSRWYNQEIGRKSLVQPFDLTGTISVFVAQNRLKRRRGFLFRQIGSLVE